MASKHISRIGEKISSIAEVQELNSNTLTLCLHNNLLSSLAALTQFKNLVDLNVSLNYVTSTQGLQTLRHLTCLNLSSNHLENCMNLDSLSRLNSLHLQFNRISSIAPLCQLQSSNTPLAYLDLRGNAFNSAVEAESLRRLSGIATLRVDPAASQARQKHFLVSLSEHVSSSFGIF